MSQKQTEEMLREILAGVVQKDVSELARDDDLVEALGIDSLAGLRALAAAEKRFDVRFPDERLGEFRSVNRILEFIEEQKEKENS
jgi:acyl carrier protein